MEETKLIYQTGGTRIEDDPSYPFKLEVNLSPPSFMLVAFIGLYGGSEELVVRGKTVAALNKVIEGNNLRSHPRLRHLKVTGNDGTVVEDIRR